MRYAARTQSLPPSPPPGSVPALGSFCQARMLPAHLTSKDEGGGGGRGRGACGLPLRERGAVGRKVS